jgi:GNAT superfamily N-acetyltransferase
MTPELVNKSAWIPFLTLMGGTPENYLKYNVGFVLYDRANDTVIAEAQTFAGDNRYAINVNTLEAHRKKGYGNIVVTKLLQHFYGEWRSAKDHGAQNSCNNWREFTLYWSCDCDNPGSYRIAESNGFQLSYQYDLYRLSKPKPAS